MTLNQRSAAIADLADAYSGGDALCRERHATCGPQTRPAAICAGIAHAALKLSANADDGAAGTSACTLHSEHGGYRAVAVCPASHELRTCSMAHISEHRVPAGATAHGTLAELFQRSRLATA